MPQQPPVIVVPGITGVHLSDYYPLPPEKVWTQVFIKQWERTAIHPLAHQLEARQPALVQPTSIFELVYADLVNELRSQLKEGNRVTPVFPFAYDWRLDCEVLSGHLSDFIDDIISRTALLPHYQGSGAIKVDLVGHSMGGLIIAGYLAKNAEAKKKVRRVVTMGTPFRGSVDAVLKLIIGKGLLTGDSPRDRERSAARTAQSLYQLLPDFAGAVESKETPLKNLFNPNAWQPSLVKGLAELIKEVNPALEPKADQEAARQLKAYLGRARQFRKLVNGLDLTQALGGGLADWLSIAGVGSKTTVHIGNSLDENDQPRFKVLRDEDKWPGDTSSPHTGDGTVPFLGAVPGFLPMAKLVCVNPGDFSRWELFDRFLAWASGFHGFLPVANLVQRLVIRHLKPSYTGSTWGWPPPTLDPDEWDPPDWVKRRTPNTAAKNALDDNLWADDHASDLGG